MRLEKQLTTLRLNDGREISVDYHPPEGHSTKRFVYLPGSAASLTKIVGPGLPGLLRATHAHLLVINKVGVQPRGRVKRSLFEASFTRHRRISDVMEVINQLIPQGHNICLIGYSEGAYLAPQIALQCARVRALLPLAGGTRGWIEEEMNKMTPTEFKREQRHVTAIYAGNSPAKRWRDFSHRTWASFDTSETLEALEKLTIPTLSIYGSGGSVIDQSSLRRGPSVSKIRFCLNSDGNHGEFLSLL